MRFETFRHGVVQAVGRLNPRLSALHHRQIHPTLRIRTTTHFTLTLRPEAGAFFDAAISQDYRWSPHLAMRFTL